MTMRKMKMSQNPAEIISKRITQDLDQTLEADPYSLFLFAMNSPETKDKYITRLKKFFDFIGLKQETMEERCQMFVDNSKANIKYPINSEFGSFK